MQQEMNNLFIQHIRMWSYISLFHFSSSFDTHDWMPITAKSIKQTDVLHHIPFFAIYKPDPFS